MKNKRKERLKNLKRWLQVVSYYGYKELRYNQMDCEWFLDGVDEVLEKTGQEINWFTEEHKCYNDVLNIKTLLNEVKLKYLFEKTLVEA